MLLLPKSVLAVLSSLVAHTMLLDFRLFLILMNTTLYFNSYIVPRSTTACLAYMWLMS